MKKIFFLIPVLLFKIAAFACGGFNQQVYTGEITYQINPHDPFTCIAIVTLDFDVRDTLPNDSIWINWGDATGGSIFAISITPDTLGNRVQGFTRFYTHIYSGTHTYSSLPASGFYHISVLSQFRISYINNIEGGTNVSLPYYIEATVGMDTTAGFSYQLMPVSPPLTISYGYIDTSFDQTTFLYDPDGDSIGFDLITPLEDHNSPVPLYMFPDSFCVDVGEPSPFSINHQTGEIIWANPCFTGVFAMATKTRKFRNGHLLGSTMRDQNVFVNGSSPTNDISPIGEKPAIQLTPNPASSLIQLQTDQPLNISIINVLGETIRKQNIQTSTTIDISDLQNGIYFVRDEKTYAVAKFVKE